MKNRYAQLAPLNAGETLSSNFSRISSALEYRHARNFGAEASIDFQQLSVGVPHAVRAFADLLECSVSKLWEHAIIVDGGDIKIGEVALPKRYLNRQPMKFCPLCTEEDEMNCEGRRGYRAWGRRTWLVNAVRVCRKHEVKLQWLPECQAAMIHDFTNLLAKAKVERQGEFMKTQRQPQDHLDRYVSGRISGETSSREWADVLPLHVVIRTAELVGMIDRHGPSVKDSKIDDAERSRCCGHGMDVLAAGEQAFRDTVRSICQASVRGRIGDIGGKAVFGLMYESLAYGNSDETFAPIRIIMREVALDNLPLGPGDEFFGPVTIRRMHSVQSAAKQFPVHPKRLKKLLVKTGAVPEECLNQSSERILLDAERMERFVSEMMETLDVREAMKLLGASRTQFDTLVRDGHLIAHTGFCSSKEPVNGVVVERQFPLRGIQALLDVIASKPLLLDASEERAPMPAATSTAGCRLGEAMELLLTGRLANVVRVPSQTGFESLRFDIAELRSLTRLPDHGCLSLRQVEEALKTTSRAVKGLISEGHLRAVTRRNPVKRHIQTVVEPADLKEFSEKFISLHQISLIKKIPMLMVRSHLKGVEQAFSKDVIGASFYRRDDII